jgi:hypothetical protein
MASTVQRTALRPEIIILCVRRYLRLSLSQRNLEGLMAERNLRVDHVTIWPGVGLLNNWDINVLPLSRAESLLRLHQLCLPGKFPGGYPGTQHAAGVRSRVGADVAIEGVADLGAIPGQSAV